jgi:hypothetical protein
MPCVPGRNSNAGIAVWLTMKNSASPQLENSGDGALGVDRFIDSDDVACQAVGVEALTGGGAGIGSEPAPEIWIGNEASNRVRE